MLQSTKKGVKWSIFYDGVLQVHNQISSTQKEALLDAEECIRNLKKSINNGITGLYPDNTKWEMVIW